MSTITKDLGVVTAYGYYKAGGGTMTESEFTQFMVNFGTASKTATEAAQAALESKNAAKESEENAAQKSTEASESASTASAKATEATTAAGASIDAKNDAVTAKTAAETAQCKAEDAQAAAESVVESIPSDYSQLSEDVSELKSGLNKFYSEETETGKVFRFGESDGVLKVVPDSAVTVGNQNILDTPLLNYNEYTVNGVTYQKQADGSIRISGTATANTNIWLNQTAKFPQGTYTLSGCPSGGSNSTYRIVCNYRISGVDYTWLIDTGNGITADLTKDIDNIRCAITIFSGATVDLTFYPQLEYASTKSEYATCTNETISANTEITIDGIKTVFANTAFNLTVSKCGWTDDILNVQNEVNALSDSVDEAEKTVAIIDGLLTSNVQHFNIDDCSMVCIHHDNFSRAMTGWEIGMNAGGTDKGNNYEWVTAESYDDGLRVDEGATFEANSSRTNNFSLRKIATDHADDFVIETNAPTINNLIYFAYNVKDNKNMTYISCMKKTNGYGIIVQTITDNRFGEVLVNAIVSNVLAKVLRFCFLKNWLYVLMDNQLVYAAYIGDVGTELYLFGYKGATTHYDFVNIFNIVNHVEWNPNHILDTGASDVPLIVTSANDGGYTLQNNNTRWSNYADKFLLKSTDPLVHNGHRSERSVANLSGYTGNLRHLRISFDAYFPSTSVDSERNDIMMQMHDRDGTYRGFVPFILNFDNNKIKITLASTHAPKDGTDAVLKWVEGAEIASINADKWHRFELEIKERYDENQNPFVKISIDNKLVFESHKPNCFNDLLGSSPQYGIYKNLWGTGVTTFERYFDNFKIEY